MDMLQTIRLSFIAVVLGAAWAPEVNRAAEETFPQVPLFNDGVMIRIPVTTLGQTLYFLLDSGFTVSAMDAKYQQLLGDPITTYFAGSPLGTDTKLPAFHFPAMAISGKSLDLEKIICLNLQMPGLISEQQCDGILGMDFLEKYVVSIDFDKNVFGLIKAVPESVKKTSMAIPLERSSQYYSLDVLVNHDRHLTWMVDTGDNSSISLNAEGWLAVFGDSQTNVIIATVANAANRAAPSKIGVIRNMTIGNLSYTNLHATFIRNPNNPSHIGLGFFKRHNVTFDFAHRMIYIKPGQRFAMPDKEDMSGLHLLREGTSTFVYSVDENSPAFNQGVRPKDIIEIVNGQVVPSLTMRDIRRLLQSRDGDKVDLQIKRGDNVLNVVFALKQTI
jgi:hypothetical protein